MTARKVYERALTLINERDGEGEFHSDIKDFEKNAPEIINSLTTLLLPVESVILNKPIRELEDKIEKVSDLDSPIPLHKSLLSSVMPYLLASTLISEEDSVRADYFYNLYKDARESILRSYASCKRSKIRDVYGGKMNGEEF